MARLWPRVVLVGPVICCTALGLGAAGEKVPKHERILYATEVMYNVFVMKQTEQSQSCMMSQNMVRRDRHLLSKLIRLQTKPSHSFATRMTAFCVLAASAGCPMPNCKKRETEIAFECFI